MIHQNINESRLWYLMRVLQKYMELYGDNTIEYDDTECDGMCLFDDIIIEIDYDIPQYSNDATQKVPESVIQKVSELFPTDYCTAVTSIRELAAFNFCKNLVLEILEGHNNEIQKKASSD